MEKRGWFGGFVCPCFLKRIDEVILEVTQTRLRHILNR